MTKKILMAWMLGLAAFSALPAHAYDAVYEKGFSTATFVGASVSSGAVAVELTQTIEGFNVAGYRINNPESSDIFVGYDVNVSTSKWSAKYGERVPAGGSATFNVGRNPDLKAAVRLFAKAADALTNARVNVTAFGYK